MLAGKVANMFRTADVCLEIDVVREPRRVVDYRKVENQGVFAGFAQHLDRLADINALVTYCIGHFSRLSDLRFVGKQISDEIFASGYFSWSKFATCVPIKPLPPKMMKELKIIQPPYD